MSFNNKKASGSKEFIHPERMGGRLAKEDDEEGEEEEEEEEERSPTSSLLPRMIVLVSDLMDWW